MTLSGKALSRSFFQRPAPDVAHGLVGAVLLVGGVGGTIVETEAYDRDDPASHSFRGQTARNAAMFGPAGHAYIYRSYGIHWCLNFVCGSSGGDSSAGTGPSGSAVLIRALEPLAGLDLMRVRRPGASDPRQLCSGPGRLCQALDVTGALDGKALDAPPFLVLEHPMPVQVAVGRRIGITRGGETPWRFGLSGSRFLSRPLR